MNGPIGTNGQPIGAQSAALNADGSFKRREVTTSVVSNTITINTDNADTSFSTVTAAFTLAATVGTPQGRRTLLVVISSNATYTITFNASFKGSTDQILPTQVLNGRNYFLFVRNPVATATWDLLDFNRGFV